MNLFKTLAMVVLVAFCKVHAESGNPALKSSPLQEVPDFAKATCLSITEVQKGDHKAVQGIVSMQYLNSANAMLNTIDTKSSSADRIASDFEGYKILSIDSVFKNVNAAVMICTVQFDPKKLVQLKEDVEGLTDPAILFDNTGGMTYSNPFENHEIGNAAFYLVKQSSSWKIHAAYFSLKKLNQDEINSVLSELNKISS
jgi:hypothetical protein